MTFLCLQDLTVKACSSLVFKLVWNPCAARCIIFSYKYINILIIKYLIKIRNAYDRDTINNDVSLL